MARSFELPHRPVRFPRQGGFVELHVAEYSMGMMHWNQCGCYEVAAASHQGLGADHRQLLVAPYALVKCILFAEGHFPIAFGGVAYTAASGL